MGYGRQEVLSAVLPGGVWWRSSVQFGWCLVEVLSAVRWCLVEVLSAVLVVFG